MFLTKEQLIVGEWYCDYLEETGCYHIFHTESEHSPYSYASKEEAESKVDELNGQIK